MLETRRADRNAPRSAVERDGKRIVTVDAQSVSGKTFFGKRQFS